MLRILALTLTSTALASVTVNTPLGNVIGSLDAKNGVSSFKGIRYAKAPIGNLRFADPEAWTDSYPSSGLDATKFGAQCVCGSQYGSEDCLFMNIYVPSAQPSSADKKPVLFFVHGGAFVIGAGADYDGTTLAKKHDAVVVTINYRLGSFGWVQLEKGDANFGLKDQREALEFIKRSNFISAFGGDMSRVMLFGESAGAISVAVHLVAPKSKGLFSSALMESGMPSGKTQTIALEQGTNLTKASGCSGAADVLACMRGKKTAEITKAENVLTPPGGNVFSTIGWGPTVDGTDLPEDPLQMFLKHENVQVPVVAGSNTNEGDLFVYPSYPLGMSNDQYKDFVRGFVSNGRPFKQSTFDGVLQMYPPSSHNRESASELIADATFICGAKVVAQHTTNSWLYHFNFGAPKPVIHSQELTLVFENGQLGPESEKLATTMGRFWESLAASGKPAAEAEWPAYKNDTDQDIILDKTLSFESGRRKKYCDFWISTLEDGFTLPDVMGALAQVQANMVPPSSRSSLQFV